MFIKVVRISAVLFFCCAIFALILVDVWAGDRIELPVFMSPHKIILNAECKGSLQDLQAIVSWSCSGSCSISGDAMLLFQKGDEGEEIVVAEESISFRYCAIDDNILISFDRQEVQEKTSGANITGDDVIAIVRGEFTTGDGSEPIYFEGSDIVEVLASGKK